MRPHKKATNKSHVKIARPHKSNNFNILDKNASMYLTQLRVGLNDLK